MDNIDWLYNSEVICYFIVLIYSGLYCFLKCKSLFRVALSVAAMSVTWYYIVSWTIQYKRVGRQDLFNDAYIDVLSSSHYATSAQLLTWVLIAAIWIRNESVNYMLFGMLGAMASAFFVIDNKGTSPKSSRSARSIGYSDIKSIPISFVPASLLSLYAIFKLKDTDNKESFSFWLRNLHIFLVCPHFISRLLPNQVSIDKSIVYGILGLAISYFHLQSSYSTVLKHDIGGISDFFKSVASQYSMPISECQKSITCDLILCSLFSIYTIYLQTSSAIVLILAAVLMPVLTPGAVFAFYLALFDEERSTFSIRSRLATFLQKSVARRLHNKDSSGSIKKKSDEKDYLWMNLGMDWQKAGKNYYDACRQLASKLAEASLDEGDGVLACGCGHGAELLFWKNNYKLGHITGIDIDDEAADSFVHERNVRLMCCDVVDIVPKFKGIVDFNKIVSLDSCYHFEDKLKFFQDSFSILSTTFSQNLQRRRMVCVTDIAINDSASVPFYIKWMLWCMNVSVKDLWTFSQYKLKLENLGYTDVKLTSLNKAHHIFEGWFGSTFSSCLDYVIVEATCPSTSVQLLRRPSAAVIGTGLAGLITANLLARTHNVTIYEASGKCGLSGHGHDVFGEVVDVPLRIIGEGYYSFAQDFIRSLNVTLSPIRKDFLTQSNIGDNQPLGSPSAFCYTNNFFYNAIAILPHFFDVYRFNKCVYHNGLESSLDLQKNSFTWGEWLVSNGYSIDRYSDSYVDNTLKFKSNAENDSYVIWILMGQFSWMLSCTYEQVLNYPASILLTFATSLGWGKSIFETIAASSKSTGRMLRVKPSMRALEDALTYSLPLHLNRRVQALDGSRIIDGQAFDSVVIATEASAIKHILKPNVLPQVFSKIEYQPSSIVLHTDETLMPEDKNHWLAFNVQQTKGQNMCQLTAWLNEYYPDAKFPCELFQTWNPHKKPDPQKVLAESHFLRVVHTKDTVLILSDITKAQGRHGFYFAGAYAVEGMGLLEQAAVSAQRVVGLIEQRVEVQSQLAMLHSKQAGKELELIMSDLGKMKSEIDSMMPRYNLPDKTKDMQSIPAGKSVKVKSDSSKTRLKSPVRRTTSMKK